LPAPRVILYPRLSPTQKAAQRYRLKRAAMSPEQLAASNTHVNTLARERRRRNPEGRKAIEARYRRRKRDLLWGFGRSQSDRIASRRSLPVKL
jgi:hypothetical protein